jgi:hypothetical protein
MAAIMHPTFLTLKLLLYFPPIPRLLLSLSQGTFFDLAIGASFPTSRFTASQLDPRFHSQFH